MDLGSLSYPPKLCLKVKCESIFVKYENENIWFIDGNFIKAYCCILYLSKMENENETALLENGSIVESRG